MLVTLVYSLFGSTDYATAIAIAYIGSPNNGYVLYQKDLHALLNMKIN